MFSDTGLEVITNTGNTDFYPVVRVFGATSFFQMFNESVVDLSGNPLVLQYDSGLPGAVAIGGGDYVEFNFFTGTAFLNGSGANRLAGVDMRYSDFFPLIPGDNFLSIVGASALVLSNGSWA